MAKKRQRGNGTGTVYPRKNKNGKVTGYRGSYFAPDGKRRYVSAKRKSDAQRALREAMTDADRGLVFDANNQTVSGYMTRWLEDFAKANLAPRTYHNYKLQIREHIIPAFGAMKLSKLGQWIRSPSTSIHPSSMFTTLVLPVAERRDHQTRSSP